MLESPSERALFLTLQQFNSVEWMLLIDALHFMVNHVLVKADRASIAGSLKFRVPFLDPEAFHIAWRIPWDMPFRLLLVGATEDFSARLPGLNVILEQLDQRAEAKSVKKWTLILCP